MNNIPQIDNKHAALLQYFNVNHRSQLGESNESSNQNVIAGTALLSVPKLRNVIDFNPPVCLVLVLVSLSSSLQIAQTNESFLLSRAIERAKRECRVPQCSAVRYIPLRSAVCRRRSVYSIQRRPASPLQHPRLAVSCSSSIGPLRQSIVEFRSCRNGFLEAR